MACLETSKRCAGFACEAFGGYVDLTVSRIATFEKS